MITVRIWFKKQNEASYVSLLDLQRVMQRVLTRSALPVWHTLGFNPHIYMTFTCPLPLGQESLCESVDVKTEEENPDFNHWKNALNAIMPAGIEVFRVEPVIMKADKIGFAEYTVRYPVIALRALEKYNALESAIVRKKTKRGFKDLELKEYIPQVVPEVCGEEVMYQVRLPAGGQLNLNPSLLADFLEEKEGIPACYAEILRTALFTTEQEPFC